MNQPNADGIAALPGAALPEAGEPQRELDKWRERASRLLAALRERSADVERLEHEVGALRAAASGRPSGGHERTSGASAREAVIAELERELTALRDAHAALQGDLHARALTIGGLKQDLQGWKDKWQDLARRLDGAENSALVDGGRTAELSTANARLTQELGALRRIAAELTDERDALQARNANLFETTGFANRQMEVLADDLAELRGQLKTLRAEHEAAVDELEALRGERAAHALAVRDAQAETAALDALLQSLQAASMALGADLTAADRVTAERLAGLESKCATLIDALAARGERISVLEAALVDAGAVGARAVEAQAVAERMRARAEAACLGAEVASEAAELALTSAENARGRAEGEARAAREAEAQVRGQADDLLARQQLLEHQLQERSGLVLGLEQELIERDRQLERLAAERVDLQDEVARVGRNAREHAAFVQQLDDRLERQKALLLDLEQELATAQSQEAAAVRRHETELAARDGEVRALKLQVAALQTLLQEPPQSAVADAAGLASGGPEGDTKGDAASERPRHPAAGPELAVPDTLRAERDTRTLRVLNQQLRDARTRNAALLERIRDLETGAPARRGAQSGDDLTQIRGVGPRLAEHLHELGVRSYQQIAELDPESLDDPAHALAALRSRILRDGWIEQAAQLHRH